MRNLIVTALLLSAFPAYATTAFCEMESYKDSGIAPRMQITWDEDAKTVKVQFPGMDNNLTHTGRIALTRTGGISQKILHFLFTDIGDNHIIGPNSEFIIHETAPGDFTSYGISYVMSDGVKYLGNFHGMYTGECQFFR